MLKRLLLLALLGFGTYQLLHRAPIDPGPGVLAPRAPRQSAIENPEPFSYRGYKITPLANFSLEARVLGTERYRLDRESDLAPVDLALGWGPMSDGSVLSRIAISQGGRYFFWSADQLPLARSLIERNAANMHMIPADGHVETTLESLRPGQLIALKGYLIRADAPDGWRWVSSLRRSDTGRGACELVWVRDLSILEPSTRTESLTMNGSNRGVRG